MKKLLSTLGLLAVLSFAGSAPAATIPNPSFEANSFSGFPGYVNQAGNGTINDWTASGGAGLNPSGGSPFADNGTIPNGGQIAFIQNGAAASLSTTISDLTVGTTYKVSFRVNARSGNTANLKIDIDGNNIINTAVTSVGGANPYKYFAFDFTATAAAQTMTLRNDAAGDNTVVLDDFSIETRNSGWSYAAWNDDATSGVDGSKTYTHAYSFGAAVDTVINGITFTGVSGGNPSSSAFSTAGLPNGFPGDANNVTGGSRQLANDFLYNGFPASITINGLIPGTLYVATIYSVGWENGTRAATFSVGNDRLTVNQDHFGDNNGIRFSYRYVATATSITLTYTPLEGNSIHTYGFSNYEFGPPQVANPSFEIDPVPAFPGYGSITAWAGGGGGINNAGGPFHDNGVIPNGAQIAFKQADGALSQLISGFIPGASYRITYAENARNCCGGTSPFNEVKIGGVTIVASHAVNPVGGANAYHQITSDAFTAASTDLLLEFIKSNGQAGDNTLLLDNVGIVLPNTPPTIGLQPQSQSAGVGDNVTFSVAAGGSAPISYQWRKGVTDIPGANGPTLALTSVTLGDSGDYSVHVSNLYGMVDSAVASLVVRSVVAGLFNTGVDDLGDAMADSSPDTHYSLIVNPDSATTVPLVEDSTVFPIVTGPWVANNARSKWIGPRLETSQAAGAAGSGGDYTYRTVVDLTGFDPASVAITGVWATDNEGLDIVVNGVSTGQRNTTQFGGYTPFSVTSGLLAGLNNIDFQLNNSAVGYTGLRVDQARALGTALPAGTAPFIVQQPQSINPTLGSRVTFSVRANGSSPLSYQWFFGVDALPGETRSELSFTVDFGDVAGDYTVEIASPFGSVRSTVATLTVRDAPLILTQPQSQIVAVGDTVNFTVTADGAEPLSYQWTKNGAAIPGANSPTLTLNSVTLADAGSYAVRVSNFAGAPTSANATLTVLEAIPGLFNTGVDGSGVSLPSGTVDPHWTITASVDPAFPGPDAVVLNDIGFPIPPWLANDEFSKWIAPQADQSAGNLEGDYNYRTTFNPAGFDPASVRVVGEWATDNFGTDILVNGVSTGQRNDGQFVVWTPFQINSGFVAGANSLDFKVNNAPSAINPTGFRVRNLRALGVRLPVQPPTVAITSPASGAMIDACTTATICADASAAGDTSIAQVVFMAAGVGPIGMATTAPYCVEVPNAPAGAYVLTAIATDSNGNSATSAPVNVTVVDGPPVVNCPNGVTAECTGGLTPVTFTVTATDACEGPVPVTCVPPSGTGFRLGTSNVVCTARDSGGRSGSCSFTVTVADTTPPTVGVSIFEPVQVANACGQTVTIETSNSSGVPVLYISTCYDVCGIDSFNCNTPPGGLFPIGTTTVTCICVDRTGNSSSCSFTVEVRSDNQPPTAVISSEQLIDLGGEFEHPVLISCNWWNACLVADGWTSSDPEGGALTYLWTLEPDPMPFGAGPIITNCLEVGEHTILLTVTDVGGLTGTTNLTIEVVTAPLAIEVLIEQVNESHKSGYVLSRKIKRELTETLRVALRFAGEEKLRETLKALDAFEKKVRALVAQPYPELATAWIGYSQLVSEGMLHCIKPPRKHKQHDPKDPKDPKEPTDPQIVTICHQGATIEVSREDLQAHLDHGDTLGPCVVPTVTICYRGDTIQVRQDELQAYLAQGATIGACEN